MRKAFARGASAAVLAGMLLGGVAHGADDTATDVKAKTDAINLQILEENLRKARLENDKNEKSASGATGKALVDALPNPTSGGLEVKTGGGQAEANMLAGKALKQMARQIGKEARATVDAPPAGPAAPTDNCTVAPLPSRPAGDKAPIVLLSGAEAVGFTRWETFRVKACGAAEKLTNVNAQMPHGGEISVFGPTTAAAVVTGVSRVLSLLTPNWEIGGVTVTLQDTALATAVAADFAAHPTYPLIWPSRVARMDASRGIIETMTALDELATDTRKWSKKLADNKKILDDKDATAAEKAAAKKIVDRLKSSEADLTAALTAYDGLVGALGSAEDKGGLPINLVVQERALAEAIGRDGLVLSVHVESAAGGYYTRKRIWHLAGGMPFSVTGGATGSYALTRPIDQRVLGAGLFICYQPYVKLDKATSSTGAVCDVS